jgi:hypothetical protein
MRRIRTEVAIIGDGAAAMMAAARLTSQGTDVTIVNPCSEFGIDDLRPHGGLSLWSAAYRAEQGTSLSGLHDQLVERLKETFPAPLAQSGLRRIEHWSVLSSTPVHRPATEELEREFFKLERKEWSTGQFRLVNPEHVLARLRRLGIDLTPVAQIEGAIVRTYALWWDAPRMGAALSQFIRDKFAPASGKHALVGAKVRRRFGRKIEVSTAEGEEAAIEAERAVLIFLSGGLLPEIKPIVAACGEPWIQGVRKRRREQHFVWFEKRAPESAAEAEDLWVELGSTRYLWSGSGGMATWRSLKGPDGLERVVDEGLRVQKTQGATAPARFAAASRAFRLDWEWKNPMWRETSHQTYWATAFEGDLLGIQELLWNLPRH